MKQADQETATLVRWQKDPQFEAAYRDAPAGVPAINLAAATGLERRSHDSAEDYVDPTAPHFTRVRAADSVLDHSAKAIEIRRHRGTVAELERAAQMKGEGS